MEKCLRYSLEMQELTDVISRVLLMHMKKSIHHFFDDDSSGGGFTLPPNSTTEALVLLSATIYFIFCWLKALEHNVLECCNMYVFNMNKLFQIIPVELPNQSIIRKERQSLLHAIGGGWYLKKSGQKLPPLNKIKLSKKSQKEEHEMKKKIQEANQAWNDCKFQIHWNKLE